MTSAGSGYDDTMRVPAGTYRLQITADFTLHDAASVLPYLHDLGVDWVYLSPILRAEPGSTHGYDVVDHSVVDPARGGAEGLAVLSAEARRLGMGVLVDVVPNHMGVATPRENAWWWDLLQHGRGSRYADAFDVDWDAGGGRILLPVVGEDDDASIRVDLEAGLVRYHHHAFPLAPGTTTREEQHYDLVSWRRGDAELNYRRFFSITTLAGIRVEERSVFGESHAEIRRWVDKGLVDGLRIDHPDGLRDPAAYLSDLRELTGGAYVVVEKILEPGERLEEGWATAGTTGYDVLGLVDRVLTDPGGEQPLTDLETRLRGAPLDWHALVHDRKRAVADQTLLAEVRRLAREIAGSMPPVEEGAEPTPLVEEGADMVPVVKEGALRPSRDHGNLPDDLPDDLADALAELLACFPVYRSYLPAGREHLDAAFADARRRRPELAEAFTTLEPVLADPTHPAARRFQQTSGAVMAKGVEDNAFYRTSRLTSLCEVGGDPSVFAVPVDEFHDAMADRQASWPRAMTTTTTHDTKRSEDTRARITVLAELPSAWSLAVDRLAELAPMPDPSFASLVWQAVYGAWPASRERLHAYAEKAMREAGEHTTWTDPDERYEQAVHAAIDTAYDDARARAVLDDLVEQTAGAAASNGLAAKLLALTMPGVPDVYQGTELWDRSLVDPDNRRPVDYALRREVLAQVRSGERPVLTPHADDTGRAKLLVTQAALTLRRDQAHRFTTYVPLAAEGEAAEHVVAFDRGGAVTVVTRLPLGLATRGWGETVLPLPDGTWVDLLSGREHVGVARLDAVLADYPVALLVREEA
jgi:(1->4)-alpha-D-glucan 1-alpha-D-glucosylmutase